MATPNRDWHLSLGEQPVQPPKTHSATILILRFDRKIALSLARRHKAELRQQGFGTGIAVQNIVLRTLFIIDHELHRDTGAVRPFRMRRMLAIADHIARIVLAHIVFLHDRAIR